MEYIMKKLVLIFVVSFSFLSLWGLIQSAPSGGDWGEETSWIGYIVPGPNDDVLITSNIVLNVDDVSCHNLTISSSGLIQNDSWHRLLTINGDLSNAGIIRNCSGDPGGYYHLYISIYGNMENSGNIINYQILFSGSEDQYLTNTDTGSLSPVYITDENSASSLILLSNVNTNNSKIDMNMSHLVLNSISGTFNLSMSGGYLTDAIIIGGNGASLFMTGGCYLENISADEIVFNETVIIRDNVIINILINQGIVYSFTNSERTLTINQKLENYGTIRNNDSYYTLCINIGGDLYNYGSVVNKTINLTNAIEHLLYIDDESHSINCTNFTVSGEGSIKAISNLYFLNCNINLNNRTMILYDDNNSFGLYLNGGSLSNSVLDGGTGSVLKLENNAYLSNVSMDDFIWQGTVMVQDNVSIDNLINQATVYGVSNNTRTLTINQRLDNYGTIRNNPGNYWLYINIGGDLYNYNYGNIVNNKIDLTGTVQHKLYQSDSSPSFNCTNFIVSGEGSTKALSNIYFLNCEINLNGKTMILYDEDNSYGLYINGGKLLNASLDGGTGSVLKLENNAYLDYVSMDDFIWQGTVMVQDNVSIDNLINQATVYGVSNYDRTLTINQRLDNYGTIRNIPGYWLYLNIGGDLYNYSSIINRQITMNGTQDQHVQHMTGSSINVNYFTLASDVGAAYWYFNDSTTPVNSSPANSININPIQYGTWQPRNPETGENGRCIIISTGEAHIDTPTAFTIYTVNGIPKLRWNQVSNALFYHLFVSTTPEGLSTVTPITIYDTDLSDNIVEVNLEGADPIQFYRVTAGY